MHYVVWRESYIQCNTQRCILTKPCPLIFQFLAWRMKIKELSRRHNLYHFMRYFLLICNYKKPCSKHVIFMLCGSRQLQQMLNNFAKAHSLCKQCLHDLHILKKGYFSPNLSKLLRADISCHFMKTRSCCRGVYSMNGL